MGRKIQYHIRNVWDETKLNWAKKGYVVKPGAEPVLKWTNCYCQHIAYFFGKEDVMEDADKAKDVVEQYHQWALAEQRQRRAEKRKRQEEERQREAAIKSENIAAWKKLLNGVRRIVVFDTETTGLNPTQDFILSLSWQVLDGELNTIDAQTRYFKNPLPEDECYEAIEINGLTNERLAELGTSDKAEGLAQFAEACRDADMLIAHNYDFDSQFVVCERYRAENGINGRLPFRGVRVTYPRPILIFDTMTEMTWYCHLPRGNGELKWPRLGELAYILDIDTDNIDWHHSSSDVEVTVRCFRKIIGEGLTSPPNTTNL